MSIRTPKLVAPSPQSGLIAPPPTVPTPLTPFEARRYRGGIATPPPEAPAQQLLGLPRFGV